MHASASIQRLHDSRSDPTSQNLHLVFLVRLMWTYINNCTGTSERTRQTMVSKETHYIWIKRWWTSPTNHDTLSCSFNFSQVALLHAVDAARKAATPGTFACLDILATDLHPSDDNSTHKSRFTVSNRTVSVNIAYKLKLLKSEGRNIKKPNMLLVHTWYHHTLIKNTLCNWPRDWLDPQRCKTNGSQK